MSDNFWNAPNQPFKTTLDGRMSSADTSMAVVSTAGLIAPGILLISRQDGAGIDTPEDMEYISFTGVLSKSVTGLGRGLNGTDAKDHNSGSIVESFLTGIAWEHMIGFVQAEHDSLGNETNTTHITSAQVTGISGVSGIKGDLVFVPISGVTMYPLSLTSGYPSVVFDQVAAGSGRSLFGSIDSTDTGLYKSGIHLIGKNETIDSFSMVFTEAVSTASVIIDVFKNNVSLFGTNACPILPQGGTYISTASLANKTLKSGDIISISFT